MKIILGLCGPATVGKDTFCKLLTDYLGRGVCYRIGLADPLKEELAEFVKSQYQLDIFNLTSKQKELLRPLMVAHGEYKRMTTDGRYWVDLAQKRINNLPDNSVICITDIRYCDFEKTEHYWVQKENHGFLVYIDRIKEDGKLVEPANDKESHFCPLLKKMANYKIKWPTIKKSTSINSDELLRPYVKDFVGWLYDQTGR